MQFKVAHNPLTAVTLTVATVLVDEPGGDGESMATEGESLNFHANENGPEGSRWDKGEISARATTSTCRVLQSRLDSKAVVAIKAAFSCNGRDVINTRYFSQDATLPVWR